VRNLVRFVFTVVGKVVYGE